MSEPSTDERGAPVRVLHVHAYVLTDVRERMVCRCGAVAPDERLVTVVRVLNEPVGLRWSDNPDAYKLAQAAAVVAVLDAHPVQDEGASRAAFQEGYEFALIHLDDEPVQADLARLRPDSPVQECLDCGRTDGGCDRVVTPAPVNVEPLCERPPKGWICARLRGHRGPCLSLMETL